MKLSQLIASLKAAQDALKGIEEDPEVFFENETEEEELELHVIKYVYTRRIEEEKHELLLTGERQ